MDGWDVWDRWSSIKVNPDTNVCFLDSIPTAHCILQSCIRHFMGCYNYCCYIYNYRWQIIYSFHPVYCCFLSILFPALVSHCCVFAPYVVMRTAMCCTMDLEKQRSFPMYTSYMGERPSWCDMTWLVNGSCCMAPPAWSSHVLILVWVLGLFWEVIYFVSGYNI